MELAGRQGRTAAVNALKRELIRDAAKRVFLARGLTDTSVREIAREAGYTTGAIYFHYASKEEIYADILRESLMALQEAVSAARAGRAEAVEALAAAFRAFIAFYRERPHDLALGLYLFEGAGPKGLNRKLDRELNERLIAVMDTFEACLADCGVGPRERKLEAVVLFNELIGLLLAADTARLRVFGVAVETMIDRHVRWLRKRIALLTRARVKVTAGHKGRKSAKS